MSRNVELVGDALAGRRAIEDTDLGDVAEGKRLERLERLPPAAQAEVGIRELARRIGVTPAAVSVWLKGTKAIPAARVADLTRLLAGVNH